MNGGYPVNKNQRGNYLMKIVSFNMNGIRSAERKGFFSWLAKTQPDVLCFQELKAQLDQLSANFYPKGYHCYFSTAIKKGYSGVALYSKIKPLKINTQFPWDRMNDEGRFVEAEFERHIIVSVYLPSGTTGDARQAVKMACLAKFEQYLIHLKKRKKEIIICGDINIAHHEIDLKNWRGNKKNSGFLPEERAWLDKVFGPLGYIDAFREINKKPDQYTWWSSRGQAYANNVGWRIDYQIVSPGLKNLIKNEEIFKDIKFSDHAPLIIEYDMQL